MTVASKDTFVSLNTKFETEDFAIDDLVSFTAAWNASTRLYEIQAVKTLEKSLTGTLTQYTGKTYTSSKWDGQSNFSVDGTKYKYSANAYIDSSNNAMNDFSVGKSDLNVYLDAYGYALYVEGVETEINYAVVILSAMSTPTVLRPTAQPFCCPTAPRRKLSTTWIRAEV